MKAGFIFRLLYSSSNHGTKDWTRTTKILKSGGPLIPASNYASNYILYFLNLIKAIDILVTKIHDISTNGNTDASEEERNMLPFYTRKVLIEEALTLRAIAQTSHVVQVIVRHGDKYYNTNGKHNLIPLLITIMTRLGTSSTAEHRQLAVKVRV